MDLTDMFKRDAAIVDHEWMTHPGGLVKDDELFDMDALKNPNNTKPELEVQWGGGGPEIDLDEPAGVVEQDTNGDGIVDDVIVFARDMMNRGVMGRDLNRALRGQFAVETLKLASSELSEQLKLEGIVGCIAVDARGYKDCLQRFTLLIASLISDT